MIAKKWCLLVVLFTTICAHEDGPSQEIDRGVAVTDSAININAIIERAKADCVNGVYQLVKQEIVRIKARQLSGNLYELVSPVFASKQMKQLFNIGKTYSSPTKMLEDAAQLAYQSNDIESMIILSIAAHQLRKRSIGSWIFALGVLAGAVGGSAGALMMQTPALALL